MRAKEAIARIQGGLDYYPENHEDLVEYIYDLAQSAEEHQECRRRATTAVAADPKPQQPSALDIANAGIAARDLVIADLRKENTYLKECHAKAHVYFPSIDDCPSKQEVS